jgi:nucleoside-triphosphatase THEP1
MISTTDRIATVTGADSSTVQRLLATSVAGWRASGARVVGVIAEGHGITDRTCGAGFLRDIASGKAYPIYRETAPSRTTCHLDAAGVDAACADIIDQVSASDLVILSKFGKLEAMREGLARAFEVAIAAGKPVLTTVSEKHRCAWKSFAPEAICLVADEAALQAWWKRATIRTAEL